MRRRRVSLEKTPEPPRATGRAHLRSSPTSERNLMSIAGNRAVARAIAEGRIGPGGWLRRQPEAAGAAVQKLADDEGSGDKDVSLALRIERQRGAGKPIEATTLTRMEAAIGRSFDDVRVHTGSEADRLTRDMEAVALTSGKDIFFREGTYAPGSEPGDLIIGHELAHVAQQSGGSALRETIVSDPSVPAEKEAHSTGQALAGALRPGVAAANPGQVAVRSSVSPGTIQAFPLSDWLASKAAQILSGGKYDPDQRKKGIVMGQAIAALKEFESVLGSADRALGTAQAAAQLVGASKQAGDLAKIRSSIDQLKKGPAAIIETEEKLNWLKDAIKNLYKLAEANPTPEQLEDPRARDDFINSCSGGLKLAAEPLKKLPPPMSDFARFFTDADVIIRGMAKGFVMGVPTTREGREQLEKEAGTKVIY